MSRRSVTSHFTEYRIFVEIEIRIKAQIKDIGFSQGKHSEVISATRALRHSRFRVEEVGTGRVALIEANQGDEMVSSPLNGIAMCHD